MKLPCVIDRRSGTPVPSLSNTEAKSPRSSKARSPITPTFTDTGTKSVQRTRPSKDRVHSPRAHKGFGKQDISHPMTSLIPSTMPLPLDINVDREAYEPHRFPPIPTPPMPNSLETSYIEWDDNTSRLDKMKKTIRLPGQKTQLALIPSAGLKPRRLERHVNATPRVLGTTRTAGTIAGRGQNEEESTPPAHTKSTTTPASPPPPVKPVSSQSHTQSSSPPSSYTYHVTRPLHAPSTQPAPQLSYTYPTIQEIYTHPHPTVPHNHQPPPGLTPNPTTSNSPSRHTQTLADPKVNLLKTWMHGFAQKASIPTLKKRTQ